MQFEDPSLIPWFVKAMLYSAFAAIGGLLGHLFRTLDTGGKITLKTSLLKACGAGFSGFLVFLVCNAMKLDESWTGIIVGVFGWLGADATMVVLERVALRKLGLEKPTQKGTGDVEESE